MFNRNCLNTFLTLLIFLLVPQVASGEEISNDILKFLLSSNEGPRTESKANNLSADDDKFKVTIGTLRGAELGSLVDVPVILNSPQYAMMAFDFLISYDPTTLSFHSAEEGPVFFSDSGCAWEYFSYRYGTNVTCGDIANSPRTIHVVGLADVGYPWGPPNCWNPGKDAKAFTLSFQLTNDANSMCQILPVDFIWCDCFDNLIPFDTSEIPISFQPLVAAAKTVFSGDEVLHPTDTFPSLGGQSDSCFTYTPVYHSPLLRMIDFHNGGIFVECDSTPILIGDVNHNGFPYEVADAVLFTNYFYHGEAIFTNSPADQIAATDINRDGETLKLEDLVQLIRIVIGELSPDSTIDSTLTSNSEVSNNRADKTVTVYSDVIPDVIWLKFEGQVNPIYPNDDLLISHSFDGKYTRMLMGKLLSHDLFDPIQFGYTGEGELEAAQAATIEGYEIILRIYNIVTAIEDFEDNLPSKFRLYQNYPNPFNNETIINFDLTRASEVVFEVYNMLGRQVYRLDRRYPAGFHSISWNGTDNSGRVLSSGVYHYRLTADDYVASKKMILLK